MPVWQLEIALKAQSRFVWAPLLARVVSDTDVAVVIHSTWRKRFSDATMKHFLPPEVASRIISLDGQIPGREYLTGDDYLMAAIELIAPTSVCVLDDRPDMFSGGKVKSWIDQNNGRFVWCNPDKGIQEGQTLQALNAWCHADPSLENHSTPSPRS